MSEDETNEAIKNEPQIEDDAVVAVNLSKIKTAQEQAASSHGSLRAVLKSAEGKGLHLKAAKRALQIVKAGNVEEWLEENAAVTRYLKILRHGISSDQLDMFQTESALAPSDEKATLDGLNAGRLGLPETDNPHDLSTPAGQAWLDAHRRGATERELVMKMEPPAEEDREQELIRASSESSAEEEGFTDDFEEEQEAA